eukprot:4598230-Pleurochrysis_carterae.AAC.1
MCATACVRAGAFAPAPSNTCAFMIGRVRGLLFVKVPSESACVPSESACVPAESAFVAAESA